MSNSLVKEANDLYSKGNFSKAYELYQTAARTFGSGLFRYNLMACEKKLAESGRGQCKLASQSQLDPITQVLLNNSQKISLDDASRNELLRTCRALQKKKSEDAEVKKVDSVPKDWPRDLKLSALPESTNDFSWYINRTESKAVVGSISGLSIVVPTFNRTNILDITLACLFNQKTQYPYEVIVADDGSHEDLLPVVRRYEALMDIKLVRQRDYGYQLCAIRNLGLRSAKYEYVAILDCDMAPGVNWIDSYMDLLIQCDDIALIGPRKYIDTTGMSAADFKRDSGLLASLPEIITNNNVAGKVNGATSVDWRLDHFRSTEDLRLCDSPFRFFSGGNVAFAKKWLSIAGWFDEEFTNWGGEDNEFGYRLYRAGCFFRSVEGALAFHQEPPGKENETDRAAGKAATLQIVEQKVPYHYRKIQSLEQATIKRIPLVSIYIPAYNCEKFIERCVNSALNQTITDLEVCICDDGSTDGTLNILKNVYGDNPRVRFVSKKNGGIGAASNVAVRLCRGYYIGQLDSDDYLEPDAVELCLNAFMADRKLACVYTTNRNLNADGTLIANGYNWPKYSREKLATAMICHHFRMFTMRAWNLTDGFSESISNAVDYDMYLKLSEVGPFKHLNKICYNRVLHGDNTSIKKLELQKKNHFIAINNSLKRQGISKYQFSAKTANSECRTYEILQSE